VFGGHGHRTSLIIVLRIGFGFGIAATAELRHMLRGTAGQEVAGPRDLRRPRDVLERLRNQPSVGRRRPSGATRTRRFIPGLY
jgi:hypothetical protein